LNHFANAGKPAAVYPEFVPIKLTGLAANDLPGIKLSDIVAAEAQEIVLRQLRLVSDITSSIGHIPTVIWK
jgi:hypothetical protein